MANIANKNRYPPINTMPTGQPVFTGGGLPPDMSGGGQTPAGGGGGYGGPGAPNPAPLPGMKSAQLPGAAAGVMTSFNTAANRLRERIDSSTQGDINAATRFNLGRGFGNSGLQNRAVQQAQASGRYAYGQGLSDMSSKFEDQRMRGVESDRQNANFQDQTLYNMINNREGRQSDWNIANLDADTKTKLAKMGFNFTGGQNDQQRDLERMLEELRQQNDNYRQSQQMGANQQPTFQNSNLLNNAAIQKFYKGSGSNTPISFHSSSY